MSNPLIGKTITEVQWTTDKKAIRFIMTDGEEVIARADADCCSETWIENVTLPALGFPATVLSAHGIEMPDLGTPPEFECVDYYGFEIKTDKGDMTIDYRNASNGYYGGWICWPGQHFYGGVFNQQVANGEWVAIIPETDDE